MKDWVDCVPLRAQKGSVPSPSSGGSGKGRKLPCTYVNPKRTRPLRRWKEIRLDVI